MPNVYSGSKPPSHRDDALAVLDQLRKSGHVAYFAGGCVRDMLMQIEPKDYDIATDATPDRVRSLFTSTQAVGAAFGVVLVRHQQSVIEVATFRTDLEYKDGRRPSGIRFSTPEEDAARRDFTINGMFFDPIANTVVDYVGGQEDIRNKVLRAIGDPAQRFAEDHLRLLRAVRFASRFSFEIEDPTRYAMLRDAPKLVSVSPERIGEEMRLMLTPLTRASAWNWLRAFGLAEIMFRFLPGSVESGWRAGKREIFDELSPGQDIPFSLALAGAALEYIRATTCETDIADWCSEPSARKINQALRKSLKLSNAESDALVRTLSGVGLLLKPDFPSVARLKRFLARPEAGQSRALLAALAAARFHTERIKRVEHDLAMLEHTDFAPPPLITGDDLTAAGMQPGPRFKRVLDEIYDAQLEGRVSDKDQALKLARSMA